jgi:glycosyltransferase involved in cell wall biosynthesis
MARIDVLIPTCRRPAALAVTLAGLIGQEFRDFAVVVSDQSEDDDPFVRGEVQSVVRVLRARGQPVALHRHLPRRGLAEQRQFLLDQARARHVLFLDDDLILEPDLIGRMHRTLSAERCGFVGCAPIGLTHLADVRPHQQHIEWWDGPVQPETVRPGTAQWQRHHLHSAANLYHLQRQLQLTSATQRTYRIAWVGACVMYDADKLRACGGFGFWRELPAEHCGEDVLAQLRVMDRFGGCGLIPSGVYHQELPTTVADRRVDAPYVLPVELPA